MEGKRAWIYCRVAYPDAHALAVQQRHLEAYAEGQGFEIAGITTEHASGLDFSRRGLAEVSEAVAAGKVDLLLVKNLSRLGNVIKLSPNPLCFGSDIRCLSLNGGGIFLRRC